MDEFSLRYYGVTFDKTELGKILPKLPISIGDSCWLCGGSLRNFVSKDESETDIDLFFPNEVAFGLAKAVI